MTFAPNSASRGGFVSAPTSNAANSTDPHASAWAQSLVTIFAAILILIALFWPTVRALFDTWLSSTFSHCFLIIPISLFLIWERRNQFSYMTPAANLSGLAIVGVLGLFWLAGAVTNILFFQELALVAMLPAIVWTVLGTEITRRLAFPLGFLFFLVPVGLSLIPPLQRLTGNIAAHALEISGVPVLHDGHLLIVPNGSWEIATECSGIRFLVASLTLGALFAFLLFRSWYRRACFLVASAIIPLIANGFRAYGIILLGYVSNNRLAHGVDHIVYGWIFFSIVLVALFAAGWPFREQPFVEPLVSGAGTAAATPPRSDRHSRFRAALAGVAAIAILSVAPLSFHFFQADRPISTALRPVKVNSPWQLSIVLNGWTPHLNGAAAEEFSGFRNAEDRVTLYIASAAPNTKLLKDNFSSKPDHSTLISERTLEIVVNGRSLPFQESVFQDGADSWIVWTSYWVAGTFTNSDTEARLLEAKARIIRSHKGEAIIAIGTNGPAADAQRRITDFMRHSAIWDSLPEYGATVHIAIVTTLTE